MPSLDVPTWVPPTVAHQARMLYDQAAEANVHEAMVLIERLSIDPRMKRVWDELRKGRRQNHKPTAEFFYAATLPHGRHRGELHCFSVRAGPARQGVAAGLLFHQAVSFRLLGAQAVPRRRLDAAAMIDDNDPLVVERNRGDAEARGYVICLAETCRELFCGPDPVTGQPVTLYRTAAGNLVMSTALYTTVATIASVGLERNITARAVRQWCDQQKHRAAKMRIAYPHSPKRIPRRVHPRP